MTYSITKKGHSAHLCVISRQQPDLLATTVKYAIQNLPNLSNIVLNRLDTNFYASLLVLVCVGVGYFFISNAEYYIFC